MRRLLLVPAAALLLAGCARAGTAADAGPAQPSVSLGATAVPGTSTLRALPPGEARPTNIAPVGPGEPVQVGPAQIDASSIPGGYPNRITVDLEGTTLVLTGTQGSCSRATAELQGEDATTVSVQLVITRTSDGVCTAIAELVPLTVRLAQPLGDRTVVLTQVRR